MNAVRIISTPPGQAPLKIREKWIGTIIPLASPTEGGIRVGVRGGKTENDGGYEVVPREAVESLREISPEAAQWWDENFPVDHASRFVFSKSVCELVEK